jgi:flagellar biosynthetic protein FliR
VDATLAPTLFGFLAVLFRCAALCATAPLFGTRAVPSRVRLALAVVVSVAAFLGAGQPALAGWQRLDVLVLTALAETLRGLAGGVGARLLLEGARAAGHAISLAMGLGFAAVIDPLHGAESNAISELLSFVALGIAIGIGVHRDVIAWLCRSVVAFPPGSSVDLMVACAAVVADAAQAMALAIRVAYPVLVAVTSGHLAFGLLNRLTPQLGMANIGFAVAILAGGGALYLVAPTAAAIVANAAGAALYRG